MKYIAGLLVLTGSLIAFAFSFVPLAKMLINDNLPTITIEERNKSFLVDNSKKLAAMVDPNFIISISSSTLEKLFDSSVDHALAKLSAKKLDGIGNMRIAQHDLKLVLDDMKMAVIGDVEIHLPEHKTTLRASLEIRVLTKLEKGSVVYVPVISQLNIQDLYVDSWFWWPWNLAPSLNKSLEISLDAINGAINEESYEISAFSDLQKGINKEFLQITVLGRDIKVLPPLLGHSAVVISRDGIGILGEINSVETGLASEPTDVNWDSYKNAFKARVIDTFPEYVFGKDLAWISSAMLTRFILDDSYQPTSIDDVRGKSISETKLRLERINNPTFVFSASKKELTAIIDHVLSDAMTAEEQLDGIKAKFQPGTPEISLAESVFQVKVPFSYSSHGVSVTGSIHGIVSNTPAGDRLLLSGALGAVKFDHVSVNSDLEIRWPYGEVVSLISEFSNSALPAINGLLQNYPIEIPIKPLVMAGQSAQPIHTELFGRKVTLQAPMLTEWATLVHPQGISLIAEIVPYNSDVTPNEIYSVEENFSYEQLTALFKEKANLIDTNFDLSTTGFRLSGQFIETWLSPVSSAIDTSDIQLTAIRESYQQLLSLEGPDMALGVSSEVIESIARKILQENQLKLQDEGLKIDDLNVEFSFDKQLISAKVPFSFQSDGLHLKASVTGGAFVGGNSNGLSYRPVIMDIDIKEIQISLTENLDLEGLQSSLNALSASLLPLINGMLETVIVDIKRPKPFELDFKEQNAEKELVITPETFKLDAPEVVEPVVFVGQGRVAIIADLQADYLPKRTQHVQSKDLDTDVDGAFKQFQTAFIGRWSEVNQWPAEPALLQADLSTSRISSVLMQTWKLAGLSANFNLNESSNSKRKPVAAIPPRPRCEGSCNKPSCNRNKACPPRKECKNVSKIITTPTTVTKRLCEPVTKVITVPVTKTRRECDRVVRKLPWPLDDIVDLVCKTVEFTENVNKTVTENSCRLVKEVENVQKRVTERVCEEVADTACLATLDKCTAEWKVYDLCELPYRGCTELVRGVSSALKVIDFDKFGYLSTKSEMAGKISVTRSDSIDIAPDLSQLTLTPTVSGAVDVNFTADFEPRASSLFFCAPVKPMKIRNYTVRLNESRPKIIAALSPATDKFKDDDPATLDLMAEFQEITARGKVNPAPLTKLTNDNPDLFLTCPLIGAASSSIAVLGSIDVTTDAIVKVIEANSKEEASSPGMARLLLNGEIEHDFSIPPVGFSIPAIQVDVGGVLYTLKPELSGTSLSYKQE